MVQPFFFKIIHTCSQLHLLLRCFCATPVRVSRVAWDGGRTGVVNLADSTSWFLVDSTSCFMVSSRTRNGVWHASSKSSIGSILANFKGVSPFPGCGLESLGRDALLHSAMSESLSTCVEAIDCGEGGLCACVWVGFANFASVTPIQCVDDLPRVSRPKPPCELGGCGCCLW